MDADLEWSMWRQLGGAFGIDKFIFTPEVSSVTSSKVIQTSSMDEALTFATGELIFLEPWAEKNLADLPKLNNYTLILSDTSLTISSRNSFLLNILSCLKMSGWVCG